VTAILTQHTNAVRAEVQLRIAEAGRSYNDRFGRMDAEQLGLVATAIINAMSAADPDTSTQVDCPGCDNMGALSGYSEMRWEPDYEYDKESRTDVVSGMYGQLILYPAKFRCPFCLLLLEEEEELAVADLAAQVELRDANDDDYRDYYSDEESW
jgi:hypothetical protein